MVYYKGLSLAKISRIICIWMQSLAWCEVSRLIKPDTQNGVGGARLYLLSKTIRCYLPRGNCFNSVTNRIDSILPTPKTKGVENTRDWIFAGHVQTCASLFSLKLLITLDWEGFFMFWLHQSSLCMIIHVWAWIFVPTWIIQFSTWINKL